VVSMQKVGAKEGGVVVSQVKQEEVKRGFHQFRACFHKKKGGKTSEKTQEASYFRNFFDGRERIGKKRKKGGEGVPPNAGKGRKKKKKGKNEGGGVLVAKRCDSSKKGGKETMGEDARVAERRRR